MTRQARSPIVRAGGTSNPILTVEQIDAATKAEIRPLFGFGKSPLFRTFRHA